jgi:hypothetical protein
MYSSLGAAYYIGLLFYGLGSTVFSYLSFESHYIPRALAVWGVLSSLWASVCAFAFVIFPNFAKAVTLGWFDNPMVFFEMVLAGWLLLKGLGKAGIAEPDKVQGAACDLARSFIHRDEKLFASTSVRLYGGGRTGGIREIPSRDYPKY